MTLILVSLPGAVRARTVLEGSVDGYVHQQMAAGHIPGLALAVVRNHRVEKVSAYGVASLEFGVPVSTKTRFHVASISKSFTSIAIMKLVEQGRLSLNGRLGEVLDGLPPAWREVKISQLLDHTSGLPDVMIDSEKSLDTIADTADEALKLLREKPLDFETGSQWRYNQTNYLLLSLVIERLSGKPFADFCQAELFAPLKLPSPVFADSREIVADRATVYTAFGRDGTDEPDPMHLHVLSYRMSSIVYPAGGLNISVMDFAKWVLALMDAKLISRASLDALWTPARRNDGTVIEDVPPGSEVWKNGGRGWMLAPNAEHPAAGHLGGARGSFMVYPKDALAVIVLTNLQGAQPDQLAEHIARLYTGSR